MKLAHIADRVAAEFHRGVPCNPYLGGYDAIRDACDGATGGELSTSMLDRLADMVARRLDKRTPFMPPYDWRDRPDFS